MAIQITCPCGQQFRVAESGTFPRMVHCHACGRRMQVNGPGDVSLIASDAIQPDRPTSPTAHQVPDRSDDCPDCGGYLASIKLFARGPVNAISGVAIDSDIELYAEPDAERGWAFAMYTHRGHVNARMCRGCGRIFLYGVPG